MHRLVRKQGHRPELGCNRSSAWQPGERGSATANHRSGKPEERNRSCCSGERASERANRRRSRKLAERKQERNRSG